MGFASRWRSCFFKECVFWWFEGALMLWKGLFVLQGSLYHFFFYGSKGLYILVWFWVYLVQKQTIKQTMTKNKTPS